MFKFLNRYYHKKYHGKYQHAKKLFVFDLALLLFAFVVLGTSVFLFLWKPSLTGQIDVSISLGSERIKSGDEIHLTVDYANKSKFKLNNISLGLRLPEGFIIDRNKTAKDIFSDDSTFASLKEIKAGATGQVEIYGWFWSEPNKDARFIANLSYQPENSSDREQKLAYFVANLSDSVLTGQLVISTTTLPNFPLKFTYTLTNSGNRTLNNISIANSWNTNVMNAKDTSNISLPPGGNKVIEGQLVTPNQSGDFYFSITTFVLANNHLVPQAPSSKELKIFAPQIISSARLLPDLNYAEPNQIIPIEIKWENKGDFKLTDITLHLTSNLGDVVDWKKTAAENNARIETGGIFFDSASRTNLSDGNPNSSDYFTVNTYLLPTFNLNGVEKTNLEIYPIVFASIAGQEFNQEGARIRIPLATEVNFNNIEARYYTSEGDQLGRGPLPPQVGKTTKYWIFVKILNTTNALNNAVFNTSLPDGVAFTGKQSASIGPQLNYNSADRAISWKYNTLPANSQTGLYFEVAVTPQSSQIGQNILLTNSLHFSAIDEFTNKKFDFSRSPLSNVLNPNDAGYNLGSKVRE
ncbi:MAG: hypothetical protein AAB797_00170, partial [Patescibacteria group bacterium]